MAFFLRGLYGLCCSCVVTAVAMAQRGVEPQAHEWQLPFAVHSIAYVAELDRLLALSADPQGSVRLISAELGDSQLDWDMVHVPSAGKLPVHLSRAGGDELIFTLPDGSIRRGYIEEDSLRILEAVEPLAFKSNALPIAACIHESLTVVTIAVNSQTNSGSYKTYLQQSGTKNVLSIPVNSDQYNVRICDITPSSAGLTVFIASDMPGGYGGLDIYSCSFNILTKRNGYAKA